MNFNNIFIIAIKSLFTNKARSFLTMLGVIIGVGSVVLLTSIGTGLQLYVKQQFANLGTNTIFVVPGNPFSEGGGFGNQEQMFIETTKGILKRKYMDKILRDNRDFFSKGAATGFSNAEAKYQTTTKKVTLYGATAEYIDISGTEINTGAWFSKSDEKRSKKVIILGSKVATELFGNVDPINKKIKLDGQVYLISGVLKARGGGFGGPNFDNYIFLPLNTLFDNFNTQLVESFLFKVKDETQINQANKKISASLKQFNIKDSDFTVFDQTQLLSTITSILGVLTAGLGGIAAISLIVGGIGIMNIMLVSVTERTREIGLRKALGATPNIILIQFLVEAAMLSIIGGMIGVGLAYGGSLIIQKFFPAQVTIQAVVLAFGVSTMVGLIFGVAPAKKAAKLSPIEALRYE